MTATTEEMSKFMEMFAKAMSSMAEKQNERPHAKIFDRDFLKDAKEFNGDKEAYHAWQFKYRLGMKVNKKFYEVLKFIEIKNVEIRDCGRMDGFYPKEDTDYRMEEWSAELFEVLSKKLVDNALTTLENVESGCGFEV